MNGFRDRVRWFCAFLYWILAYIILRIMSGMFVPFKIKVKLLTVRKIVWFHKEIVFSNAEIAKLEEAERSLAKFPYGVTYQDKLRKSLIAQRNRNAHLRTSLTNVISLIKGSNQNGQSN